MRVESLGWLCATLVALAPSLARGDDDGGGDSSDSTQAAADSAPPDTAAAEQYAPLDVENGANASVLIEGGGEATLALDRSWSGSAAFVSPDASLDDADACAALCDANCNASCNGSFDDAGCASACGNSCAWACEILCAPTNDETAFDTGEPPACDPDDSAPSPAITSSNAPASGD